MLAVAASAPAWAQTADHIVINEIEINPPGDDAESIKEWVELYNPTDSTVYIGDWQISSSAAGQKTLRIAAGTFIDAGQHKSFQHTKVWFADVSETVRLHDHLGSLIDQTPPLSDRHNDFDTWQRVEDGVDSDSESDWAFARATAGSYNQIPETVTESGKVSITISSDKTSYNLEETASFEGRVSEKVFVERPFYQSAPIIMTITGPDYEQETQFYPDRNLQYGSNLRLQEVLGISAGTYDVSVQYSEATARTQITVSATQEAAAVVQLGNTLTVSTDMTSYMPGDMVRLSAAVTAPIEFEGIRFTVSSPQGTVISQGTLYPDDSGRASTEFYLNTISPELGEYRVEAQYDTHRASTTFEIVADVREDVPISLSVDSSVYALGQTVSVSGRLNDLWESSVGYVVEQTATASGALDRNALHRSDTLRTHGDGRFSDSFVIPNNSDRLGQYQITVSSTDSEAKTTFSVSADGLPVPAADGSFTVMTDMQAYSPGDAITISGNVGNIISSSQYRVQKVEITFRTPEGVPIRSIHTDNLPSGLSSSYTEYAFSAVPDAGGHYSVSDTLYPSVFEPGEYQIRARYGDDIVSASFEVAQKPAITEPFEVTINREVLGLGQTVRIDGEVGVRADEVRITLTKPDGDIDEFGVLPDESRFSWEWRTPLAERKGIDPSNPRSLTNSVFGTYQVLLWTQNAEHTVYFKVSKNPESDEIVHESLTVSTDRTEYRAGQTLTVSGNLQKRTTDSGAAALDRPRILVQNATPPYGTIHDVYAEPNIVGDYATEFALPVTVFETGQYRVVATHGNLRQTSLFSVTNDFAIGNQDDSVSIDVSLDRQQYGPGQTIHMTGTLNKLIHLDSVRIYVVAEADVSNICGQVICGTTIESIVAPVSSTGSFEASYRIPSSAQGRYEIVYDTQFGRYYAPFTVVQDSADDAAQTITEKFSRITDDFISIDIAPKTVDGIEYMPSAIHGTLLSPGDAGADLLVSGGQQCIIGPDCTVTSQTHSEGQVYVLDGTPYNVMYSGPGSTLERFTISPEISDSGIQETDWSISILKDADQRTKFYYRIVYSR